MSTNDYPANDARRETADDARRDASRETLRDEPRDDAVRREHDLNDTARRDAEPVGTVADHTNETSGAHAAPVVADDSRAVREEVVAREKAEFGGMKFGSAFFGWLTATGTAVLLTALVAGTGSALGLGDQAAEAVEGTSPNADTIGIVGAIAVLVILLVGYYCGGYVAGRMSRFSGAKQGLAVWLWAVVIAIVVAIIGALAGGQYNVLSNLDTFPRIPIDEGDLTAGGIITAVLAVVVSLVGAVLGGLGGMRYHRKVVRAGLGK